jgi:hypothetical protein
VGHRYTMALIMSPNMITYCPWFSDYRRVFDWWSNLLDSLIQHVITLTVHYYTCTHMPTRAHTHTHTHTSVHSSLPLLGRVFQWWTFPFPWVPKWSLASSSSFSQRLNPSSSLTHSLTHSPTDPLTSLTCPTYNISACTAQKKPFLCCCL